MPGPLVGMVSGGSPALAASGHRIDVARRAAPSPKGGVDRETPLSSASSGRWTRKAMPKPRNPNPTGGSGLTPPW